VVPFSPLETTNRFYQRKKLIKAPKTRNSPDSFPEYRRQADPLSTIAGYGTGTERPTRSYLAFLLTRPGANFPTNQNLGNNGCPWLTFQMIVEVFPVMTSSLTLACYVSSFPTENGSAFTFFPQPTTKKTFSKGTPLTNARNSETLL
jgi:hypothetical protein